MQSILDLGADVDSRFVVVACAADSFEPRRIANTRKDLLAWLHTMPRGSRVAMESTGGYHDLLAELAHKAALQVFVINPRDLRRYAEGLGRAEAKRLVTHIDRLIARLDLMMQRCLEQSATAHAAAKHIATIPGFGALSSTWLAQSFTRVPYNNSDAVVAASGLDPRAADSGRTRGRRRLSKRGPAEERRILFNCARSASRMQLWQPYYKAQLDKGLSSTAAATILARKMLRAAFALDANHRISQGLKERAERSAHNSAACGI